MKSKSKKILWMIHQEAQRWYVFVQSGPGLGGREQRLWQSAQRRSPANHAARRACCWHLTTWENATEESPGNYFPFHVDEVPTMSFLSWVERWQGREHGAGWASALRRRSRIPCLRLRVINVISACLEAVSFLGKDPGLAGSSRQYGGWWKTDPAEASAGRPRALSPGFRETQVLVSALPLWIFFLIFAKTLYCFVFSSY